MAFALRRETGLPAAARALLREPGDPAVWAPAGLALATELRERRACRLWVDHILGRDLADLRASASWPAVLSYLADATAWLGDEDGGRAPAADAHAVLVPQPAGSRVPARAWAAPTCRSPTSCPCSGILGRSTTSTWRWP